MPFQTRKPSIMLTLNKQLFNQLVNILDCNIKLEIELDNAKKLKDKILRYSVLRVTENHEEIVDVRFFPNESRDIILQLLLKPNQDNLGEDYFSKLVSNKN